MSSFRPIAPAEPHMDVYAGSCNPPRRAKRLRSDSASSLPHQDHPSVSPSLFSPSQPDDDDDDHPQHPPPKRRGRRPGTLSRAAREAQRKINHSLIEKARRTKINDALATLRDLVPPECKRPPDNQLDDSDDDDPDSKKSKPKASGEKEFKLEILVRTVAYLQDLTEKVNQLERNGCPRCSEFISFTSPDSSSRQRQADNVHSRDAATPTATSPVPRLPSISAWLPSSVEDQRSLLTPSQSPVFDVILSARSTQLPTPPTSATCAPATTGFPIPPVLTLPSPSTFLPSTTIPHIQPCFSGFSPRANANASPMASPIYTPDDETAASLLLRMSATSPLTTFKVGSARPVEADRHVLSSACALTPSRLLGLSAKR